MSHSPRNIVLRIYKALPSRRRRQFWMLFAGILASGMVEMGTMAVVALFASSLTDPESVLKSTYLTKANAIFGFSFLTEPRSLIIGLSIAAAGLLVVKNGFLALMTYFNARFSALLDSYFGKLLLQGFLHRRYEWHLSTNSSDLVTAIIWRKCVGNTITFMAIQTLSDATMVVLLVAMLLAAAPVVSLSVFAVLGVAASFLYFVFRPFVDRLSRRVRDLEVLVNRHVTKALHGIKDVKVSGREGPFLQDFNVYVREFAMSEALVRLVLRCPTWILEAAGFGMLAVAVLIMLLALDASLVRVTGTVALLAVAAWRILPAVNRILSSMNAIRQSTPQAEKIFDYLDECAEDAARGVLADKRGSVVTLNKGVTFENVSYFYKDAKEPALDHVDLVIPKGAFVGVVGLSGAGKSTFVDMLIGLLPPASGRILIDDVVLEGPAVRAWLDRVGYVSQFPYIYDASLAQNIAFGLPDEEIDRDKILDCCRKARIDDFLEKLPNGIDSAIGERGAMLSGGQRQRVAIARALYRDPEILILDEATSALDQQSEDAIQRTMLDLSRSITVVVVAHRLTTVEDCERIVWLDGGKVRQTGPPDMVLSEYRAWMK